MMFAKASSLVKMRMVKMLSMIRLIKIEDVWFIHIGHLKKKHSSWYWMVMANRVTEFQSSLCVR